MVRKRQNLEKLQVVTGNFENKIAKWIQIVYGSEDKDNDEKWTRMKNVIAKSAEEVVEVKTKL